MVVDENPLARWERNFAAQVQRLRELQGMTQTDLARVLKTRFGLKFHQQTIQRIEGRERPVRLDEAHLIADALGADLDTMTSDMAPTDASLRMAISAVRGRAAFLQSGIRELMFDDWFDQVDTLAADLEDRKLPEEAFVSGTVLEGIEWSRRASEATALLKAAHDALGVLGGVDDDEMHLDHAAPHIMESWQSWLDLVTEHLRDLAPYELDSLEPLDPQDHLNRLIAGGKRFYEGGGDDGEHREAT